MQNYHKYSYDGPVMEFDNCIDSHWKGKTMASTDAKARANLTYQYKKMHGRVPSAKISLPGKLKKGE